MLSFYLPLIFDVRHPAVRLNECSLFEVVQLNLKERRTNLLVIKLLILYCGDSF